MPRLSFPSILLPGPLPLPDDRHDILVLGGGMAGVCAAIAARRAGASVLVVDPAPRWMRGGNARHARNIRVPHSVPTPLSPGRYDEAALRTDLERVSGGAGDPILIDILAHHAADLPEWLAQQGVVFQKPRGWHLAVVAQDRLLTGRRDRHDAGALHHRRAPGRALFVRGRGGGRGPERRGARARFGSGHGVVAPCHHPMHRRLSGQPRLDA
ncbi:FAD-dependent oxidoreductase [Pararhodospirillum photometricum]|uniref:FAD-dependent oxidoreductase n=1 Tax=Pararhodospirillum photometricum TaxID=1084 RepID=UPI0006883CC2|nr:FAD-dependent oxidoreductase [Pararhodospirillum photometricum]